MLTGYVAATGVRAGQPATVLALAVSGACSIGLMAVVNFAIRSAYRWLLLAVAGLWAAGAAAAIGSDRPGVDTVTATRERSPKV